MGYANEIELNTNVSESHCLYWWGRYESFAGRELPGLGPWDLNRHSCTVPTVDFNTQK